MHCGRNCGSGGRDGDRGVSPVLGLVLLFGLIAAASTMIVVVGVGSTEEAQTAITDSEAQASMGEFRSEVRDVLAKRSGTASVEFPEMDRRSVDVTTESKLSLRVAGYNASGAWVACDPVTRQMGAVHYGDGEDVLAYEGNGVFRLSGDNSSVVSPPGIDYRKGTLDGEPIRVIDVPIVSVEPDGGGVGGDEVVATHETQRQITVCPNGTELTHIKSITLEVRNTDLYQAWGEFMTREFGDVADVVVDAENRTVTASGVDLGVVENDSSGGPGGLVWARNDGAGRETVHEVRWTVGDASDSDLVGGGASRLDAVEVDYNDSSDVDLSEVDGGDVYVTISPPARRGVTPIEATVTSVGTAEGGTTLTIQTQGTTVVPANSEIHVAYGEAVNPSTSAAHPTNVTMRTTVGDEERAGTLEISASGVPASQRDADDDGVPDSTDDCPGTEGTGENGCDPITASGGSLTVNQSSGTAYLLGTEVANLTSQERRVADRKPIDVMFVLDRSGSMLEETTWKDADDLRSRTWSDWSDWSRWETVGSRESGTYTVPGESDHEERWEVRRTAWSDWSDWGEWHTVGDGEYDRGWTQVPSGEDRQERWTVEQRYLDCGLTGCEWVTETLVYGPGEWVKLDAEERVQVQSRTVTGTETETYQPGDSVTLDEGEEVRTQSRDATLSEVATVPSGRTVLAHASDDHVPGGSYDANNDGYADSKWFGPGETFDPDEFGEFEWQSEVGGSDPLGKRVGATRSFVGALNATKDRAGFVDFDADGHLERGLTDDFGALNASLHGEAVGSTDMSAGLRKARNQLGSEGSDRQKVVVLLSDGENSDPADDARTRRLARAAKRNGYTIYTVALGTEADEDLLARVAGNESTVEGGQQRSGAFAYTTNDASQLETIFDQIAGEVNQQRVKTLEYARTETNLEVSGRSSPVELGLSTGLSGTGSSSDVDHGVGATLSLSTISWYGCADGRDAGNATQPSTGENYTQVDCTTTRSGREQATSTTVGRVLTDADSGTRLSTLGYGDEWYRDNLSTIVNAFDPSLTESDGDTLNLTANQALVVVEVGSSGDYGVVFYQADDSPPPGVSDPGTGSGDSDADAAENGFVVTVSGQEVTIGDDDS